MLPAGFLVAAAGMVCGSEARGPQRPKTSEKSSRCGDSHPIAVFIGGIPPPLPNPEGGDDWYSPGWITVYSPDTTDSGYRWCECGTCGALGIQFQGRSDRLPCKRCCHCNDRAGEQILHLPRFKKDDPVICPSHGTALAAGCPRSYHGDRGRFLRNTPAAERLRRCAIRTFRARRVWEHVVKTAGEGRRRPVNSVRCNMATVWKTTKGELPSHGRDDVGAVLSATCSARASGCAASADDGRPWPSGRG